jgi:ankyrin repeat protein
MEAKARGGLTPLTCAARNGDAEIVQKLIDNGADIEAKDSKGRTPLYYAKSSRHAEVLHMLLERSNTNTKEVF